MGFETKKSALYQSFAVFTSCVLVLAIVGWNMGISSAQSGGGSTSGFDLGFFGGLFGSIGSDGILSLGSGITSLDLGAAKVTDLTIVPKGEDQLTVSYTKDGTKINPADVEKEAFEKMFGKVLDKDGNLKVGKDANERLVPLKNIPGDVESIKIDDKNNVVYSIKDKGKVSIGKSDLTLQEEGKDAEKKTVIKGYKVGKTETPVVISKMSGDVSIDSEGIFSFTGTGTVLSIGENTFQPIDGGSIQIVADGDTMAGYVLKGGTVTNDKYSLEVGKEGVYFGDPTKVPRDMKERTLTLDGDTLKGNLGALKDGEKITFKNANDNPLTVDQSLVSLEKNVLEAKKGEIVFSKKSGKLEGSVTLGEGVTKPDTGDGKETVGTPEEPELPTTDTVTGDGKGDDGKGKDGDPGDDGKRKDGDPGDDTGDDGGDDDGYGGDGGDGGGSGGGNWLLWALLIGGGILAAMLLLGGDDDEETKTDDTVDDGGDIYRGSENITFTHGNQTYDGVTGLNSTYNPTPPASGGGSSGGSTTVSCTCNESGCFECPDGNCYACSSRTSTPVIETGTESDTTTENDLDLTVQ